MHDIHWAAIFTVGMFYVAGACILVSLLAARRKQDKPKQLGHGDQVSLTLATGEVRAGYVAGSSPTAINGGFAILCTKDPS